MKGKKVYWCPDCEAVSDRYDLGECRAAVHVCGICGGSLPEGSPMFGGTSPTGTRWHSRCCFRCVPRVSYGVVHQEPVAVRGRSVVVGKV